MKGKPTTELIDHAVEETTTTNQTIPTTEPSTEIALNAKTAPVATIPNITTKNHLAGLFAGIETMAVNQTKVNQDFKITDNLSYDTAQTHIKTTAGLIKKVEDRKLEKSLPYRTVVNTINDYAKTIATNLTNSRLALGLKMKEYEKIDAENKKKEAEALAKQAEIDNSLELKKQEDTIVNLRTLASKMLGIADKINNASLIDELKEIAKLVAPKNTIPEELNAFPEIHEIFLRVNDECRNIGFLKYKVLQAGERAKEPEHKIAFAKALKDLETAINTYKANLQQYIEETKEEVAQITAQKVEVNNIIAAETGKGLVSSIATSTKTYRVDKIEVIDMTQVPLSWLMIDESKVKAYVKEQKLKASTIVNGVSITIIENVRA